jgi:hypothetical protein
MNYKWSILDISTKDGLITHAKYKVSLTSGAFPLFQKLQQQFALITEESKAE